MQELTQNARKAPRFFTKSGFATALGQEPIKQNGSASNCSFSVMDRIRQKKKNATRMAEGVCRLDLRMMHNCFFFFLTACGKRWFLTSF